MKKRPAPELGAPDGKRPRRDAAAAPVVSADERKKLVVACVAAVAACGIAACAGTQCREDRIDTSVPNWLERQQPSRSLLPNSFLTHTVFRVTQVCPYREIPRMHDPRSVVARSAPFPNSLSALDADAALPLLNKRIDMLDEWLVNGRVDDAREYIKVMENHGESELLIKTLKDVLRLP